LSLKNYLKVKENSSDLNHSLIAQRAKNTQNKPIKSDKVQYIVQTETKRLLYPIVIK